jgi:hypothetical protein
MELSFGSSISFSYLYTIIKKQQGQMTHASYDILIHLAGTYGSDHRLTEMARTLKGHNLHKARTEFFDEVGKPNEDISLELLTDEEISLFYDIMDKYWVGQCEDMVDEGNF